MAGELETVVREMFAALDRGDADGVIHMGATDMQGIDEISRRWMRGLDEVGDFIRQLLTMVSGVRSSVNDVHETVIGDVGFITCWLEQDYVMEGTPQHISAPTTMLFRREDGTWKVLLFHSLPLPAESS
jgi:ketosteroid isomerase-like protein